MIWDEVNGDIFPVVLTYGEKLDKYRIIGFTKGSDRAEALMKFYQSEFDLTVWKWHKEKDNKVYAHARLIELGIPKLSQQVIWEALTTEYRFDVLHDIFSLDDVSHNNEYLCGTSTTWENKVKLEEYKND